MSFDFLNWLTRNLIPHCRRQPSTVGALYRTPLQRLNQQAVSLYTAEMTLALRVLIGLVAGFLLGLAIAGSTSPAAAMTLGILAPVGTIFLNLIRLIVIPLVMSMVVASVGSLASAGGFGRTGMRAVLIAPGLLITAAVVALLIAKPVLEHISIDPAAAHALQTPGTAPTSATGTTLAQWVVDLVPQNVIKAAAEGAILPVIVSAVLFGFALGYVSEAKRKAVLQVVEGVAEAMQRLVVWILALAPIGVFALAVPLAARLGLSAAGAVVAYIVLVVVLTVVEAALVLYPLGILAGGMSVAAFVSYCAPSQAIAFASRSSLAALPVMLESAERAGLPPSTSSLVLPLAAAVFHFGSAIAQTVGVLFLARLFAVTLTTPQLLSVIFAVVLATFAVPGIPGGSIIAMVPVLAAANLPIDGIGILLAVDTIPDMFRTTANLTGAMTLTAVLANKPS
jgi:proton glutamate symport protein